MKRVVSIIVAAVAVLAGCASSTAGPSGTVGERLSLVTTPAPVSKVIVFVGENKGYAQTRAGAPKVKALGVKHAYFTNTKGVARPSQPNYYAMTSGSTQGITTNDYKAVRGPSVMGGTIKAGRTFKAYMADMGSDNCRQTDVAQYDRKHNPVAMYVDERALCEKYDVTSSRILLDADAGTLPNVGFWIPNGCNSSHDCSLATFDNWVAAKVAYLQGKPDYRAGRLLILITMDEDAHNENQQVLTTAIHPSLVGKVINDKQYNHYSLNRLLAAFGKTLPQNLGATAPDMLPQLNLTVQ